MDIWRSAKLMVDQHAAEAPARCFDEAAGFAAKGDRDGQAIWLAIGRAAIELLENGPPADTDQATPS